MLHLLFTQPVEYPPVLVVHSKPLTVTWTNVYVDRAEVIVLLMSGCAGPRHLHVQLDRVHTKNGVADVREKVALRTVNLFMHVMYIWKVW